MAKFKGQEIVEVNLPENDARVYLLFVQTADAVLKYSESVFTRAGLSHCDSTSRACSISAEAGSSGTPGAAGASVITIQTQSSSGAP